MIQKSSEQVRKSIGALLKVYIEIVVYLDQTLDIPILSRISSMQQKKSKSCLFPGGEDGGKLP